MLRIMILGAHPDDPDSGAGGLIALLSENGHEVIAVSFTRSGLTGKMGSFEENARINEREAIMAFQLLGAKIIFLNFKDGNVWVTRESLEEVREVFEKHAPDLVITHWPIDTHSDHRSVGILTIGAVRKIASEKRPLLYFYEVMTGVQTHCFIPEIYIDITEKAEIKKKACYLHKNCFPETWYPVHEKMMKFRGLEMGVKYAEAFISYERKYVHVLKNLIKT